MSNDANQVSQESVSGARLADVYKADVVPGLLKEYGYKSVMEVPRILKIVLNMGVGEAIADKKFLTMPSVT